MHTGKYFLSRQAEVFGTETNVLFDDRRYDLIIGILENNAHLFADIEDVSFIRSGHAVNCYAAFIGNEKRIEQFCHGGFSAAVMPDYGDKITFIDFKADSFQRRSLRAVV